MDRLIGSDLLKFFSSKEDLNYFMDLNRREIQKLLETTARSTLDKLLTGDTSSAFSYLIRKDPPKDLCARWDAVRFGFAICCFITERLNGYARALTDLKGKFLYSIPAKFPDITMLMMIEQYFGQTLVCIITGKDLKRPLSTSIYLHFSLKN